MRGEKVLFTISLLADIPQLGATMILVMASELQEETLGTKVKRYNGTSNVHLYNSDLHLDLVPQDILVMAPELQEDGMVQKLSV